MATHRTTISSATNYDMTSSDEVFYLPYMENYSKLSIEIITDGITYPAAEDDGTFDVVTRETDTSDWELISTTSEQAIVGGATNFVFRIAEIATRNIGVTFAKASINAGTITVINVTASE